MVGWFFTEKSLDLIHSVTEFHETFLLAIIDASSFYDYNKPLQGKV